MEMINFKRMKLLLIIFLICEILFITLNEIPNLMNAGIGIKLYWNDKRFLIVHLLLAFISFIGIIIINILIKKDTGEFKKVYNIVVPALTSIILILISIINGLDQINSDKT